MALELTKRTVTREAPADAWEETVYDPHIETTTEKQIGGLDKREVTREPGKRDVTRTPGKRDVTRTPGKRTVNRTPGERTVTRTPGQATGTEQRSGQTNRNQNTSGQVSSVRFSIRLRNTEPVPPEGCS